MMYKLIDLLKGGRLHLEPGESNGGESPVKHFRPGESLGDKDDTCSGFLSTKGVPKDCQSSCGLPAARLGSRNVI